MKITRNTVKAFTTLLVGWSTYKITGQIIANNASPSDTLRQKVAVKTTQVTVGGVVAAKSEKYTSDLIDQIADAVNEARGIAQQD